jgi:type IV pilus assembly protein PilB
MRQGETVDRRASLKDEESTATTGGRKTDIGGGRIGEILLSEGTVTREQLELALTMKRNDPRRLGEILLSLGYVTAGDLAQALAKQLKLEYVVISELSADEVEEEALTLLDEATLRKYMVLPLRLQDGRLVVAMSNPNDMYALEDLRMLTRHPIRPVVVTEEDLEGALDHLFGGEYTTDGDDTTVLDGGGAANEVADTEAGGEALEEEAAYAAGEPSVEEEDGSATGVKVENLRQSKAGATGGRIGDILISEGKVTPEQIEEALAIQRKDRREIGQILLSLGYVGKSDLARALARRLRLEYTELTENDVDRAATSLVDQKVLRRHGVLPLRVEDGRLVVAMSDPTNFYALEDLRMLSGLPVTPVVVVDDEIRRVQNQVFAISEEVTEILEEAAGRSVLEEVGELELGDATADHAPIVRLVSSILQQAVADAASDIHVEPRAQQLAVRMRVDGVLREVMSVPPTLQSGVIARLKILANLNIAERRVPQDGRFSVRLAGQRVDLRAASLPTVYGEKVVLRLLDTSNLEVDLKGLGFAPDVLERYGKVFRRPYGTILVTGPTGSGKSTTLYATLKELNSPEKNIITVEDPVEYRMGGINQVQVNPKAGLTFASGLRSILRSDPDVVMIGEIRDHETAKISVEAALTGHLVLATLHTNDAPSAVTRLNEMGVEPYLTSSAVDCVIAQRLARRLCERCKRPVEVEAETLSALEFPFERLAPQDGSFHFHEAVGCDRCARTGYRGRIGIYEMMVLTDEIREAVLKRGSADEVRHVAEEQGMAPLRDDGLLKAARGITTIEEVLRTVV